MVLRKARPFVSDTLLSTIYKMSVRSRMEYLAPLFAAAPGCDAQLRKLEAIQRRAVCLIGGEVGAKLASTSDLGHRRGVSGMSVLHQLIHETAPSAIHDLAPKRVQGPALRRSQRGAVKNTTPGQNVLVDERAPNDPKWSTNSYLRWATAEFNKLPAAVQQEQDLQKFKTMVHKTHTFISLRVRKDDEFKQ